MGSAVGVSRCCVVEVATARGPAKRFGIGRWQYPRHHVLLLAAPIRRSKHHSLGTATCQRLVVWRYRECRVRSSRHLHPSVCTPSRKVVLLFWVRSKRLHDCAFLPVSGLTVWHVISNCCKHVTPINGRRTQGEQQVPASSRGYQNLRIGRACNRFHRTLRRAAL